MRSEPTHQKHGSGNVNLGFGAEDRDKIRSGLLVGEANSAARLRFDVVNEDAFLAEELNSGEYITCLFPCLSFPLVSLPRPSRSTRSLTRNESTCRQHFPVLHVTRDTSLPRGDHSRHLTLLLPTHSHRKSTVTVRVDIYQ